ncbi:MULTISPECIES: biotin--[acetyl-CoA-carboxylase] ligase [Clostridium]|uniref:biotin--[acetyl-CoA-carboxylase] ligase n=1 Tax=Clostridium TaxID=1485 RepID=UPI00069D71B4|nr:MULTISPECIES: biotin--[acetyl-CoA-carboxylase] ligase [Clostridium]KOF57780.1 biotin--acetyl-CoA-carboxylase ligase [Clostridium sp. DMHC 10]MCD2347255.1 biotin--[acetyl-CoA-carboxylase] ligase [Clostridium guangxiense]
MKEKIIGMLKCSNNNFISGQSISEKLGITRAAVWKYINKLKEDGYVIESGSKKGYRLISCPDILTTVEIDDTLKTKYIGRNIIHFDSIECTNDLAKELAEKGAEEGTVVIAEEQTSGRGRFRREWVAAKYKSIMMSIILKPNTSSTCIYQITQIAAAAIGKAIEELNIDVGIKWPNDIIVNWRKVCGILTEASGEIDKINYVVVGIGINVNQENSDFPEAVLNKATSLRIEKNEYISRKLLLCSFFEKFETLYDEFRYNENASSSIKYCREKSILVGKKIEVERKKQIIIAEVLEIASDGSLIVKYENGIKDRLISGEVSLHRMYE